MSNPTTEVIVTCEQGTEYMELCHKDHPQKFGVEGGEEVKFSSDDIRTYDRNCRHFFKAGKKVSPGFRARPKMIPVFGKLENWKERPKRTIALPDGKGGVKEVIAPNQPEDAVYEMKDRLEPETLHLNAYAIDALESMLVLLCHPKSPYHLAPARQESIVWEMAEQLEIVPWLEGKIGLKPEKDLGQEPAAAAPAPEAPATT